MARRPEVAGARRPAHETLTSLSTTRVTRSDMHKSRYLHEFDLLRIIAAMGVVLWHYTFRGHAADDMSILAFPKLAAVLKYVYISLYVFFMMSGFTTALSLSERPYTRFAISRIARLYPAFWIAVTVTAGVSWVTGDPRYAVSFRRYLLNLTMIGGAFGARYVDAVYWYLLVLIRFYFVLSLPVLVQQPGSIKHVAAVWMLLSIIVTFVHIPAARLVLVPEYAPLFIAGVMFFFVRKEGLDRYKVLVLAGSLGLAIRNAVVQAGTIAAHYHTTFWLPLIIGGVLALYAIFFLLTGERTYVRKTAWLPLLSSATYPLYLLHQNIGFMVFNTFGRTVNKYLVLGATLVAMILVSIAISRYVEPHIRRKLQSSLTDAAAALTRWLRNLYADLVLSRRCD